jgi:hypothetical protein
MYKGKSEIRTRLLSWWSNEARPIWLRIAAIGAEMASMKMGDDRFSRSTNSDTYKISVLFFLNQWKSKADSSRSHPSSPCS